MKADSISISKVFSGGGDIQYTLPHFQREYAWDKENWDILLEDLWDIYNVYESDNEPEHFMGALVVINDGTRNGTIPVFKLVDGQQRLTTISLLLCALGKLIKESHPGLYKRIRKVLLNLDEDALMYYKLVPTAKRNDRGAYTYVLLNEESASRSESRITKAFEYFVKILRIRLSDVDAEKLSLVILNCLHVVFITLDAKEKPYEIFESLNAKGKPLTAPDLVRNYIAMRLPDKYQEEVFDKHWLAIEDLLNENRSRLGIGELTAFLRHYISLRSNSLCARDRVYQRFRDRMEKEFSHDDNFVEEIKTLHRFALYYDKFLRPENETNNSISERLKRLNILESSTAYPFLMQVYEDYSQGVIDLEEFYQVLDILENYTMRRYLANYATNYTNKMFPNLHSEIDPSNYVQSLKTVLINKNYPSNNSVREILKRRKLYETKMQPRLAFMFDSINRYLSRNTGGYTILDGDPTIEHILPQTLSNDWKRSLIKTELDDILNDDLQHTLGNLTIVTKEWNSTLSNSLYTNKKSKLAEHALLINQLYFSNPDAPIRWNKDAILSRTEELTNILLDIWVSFGEANQDSDGYKNKTPYGLIVSDDTYDVKSWREVSIRITEIGIDKKIFSKIQENFPQRFTKDARDNSSSHQLSNTWWLYTQGGADFVMSFCQKVASLMNLSDEEWEVLYK